MVAFSIWSINIYWYGIFYVISFIVAYFFLKYIANKWIFIKNEKIQNILDKNIEDLILYSVIWVLIWWRLWQVIIYDFVYYLNNPIEILQFWKWWMSFIWWMFWVFISIFVFATKNKLKKANFICLLDLILIIAPFGIMLWRLWNFLNQELYGISVPSTYWGFSDFWVNIFRDIHLFHIYDNIDNLLRINTNLLAWFLEWFVLLVIVWFIFKRFIKNWIFIVWYITWIFLSWYSFIRFLLEYLRLDSQSEFVFYLTKSQWFFVFFFVLWLLFLFSKNKQIKLR